MREKEISTGFLMAFTPPLLNMIFRTPINMAVTITLTEEFGDMEKLQFRESPGSPATWFWMKRLTGFILPILEIQELSGLM